MITVMIWIGFYLLMFDFLFKVGEKVYQNKFSRRIVYSIALQVLMSLLLFLLEYGVFSENGQNVGYFLLMINRVYFLFLGKILTITPILVVVTDMIEWILIFCLLYKFVFYILSKLTIGLQYDKEDDKLLFQDKGKTLRISGEKVKSVLFLTVLMTIEIHLGFFYFWFYSGQLSSSFLILFIILLILLVFAFIFFSMSMKEVIQSLFIQAMFMDISQYHQVMALFDEYLEVGISYLTVENYDSRVRLAQDLDIIRTVERLTLKDIAELKRVPIEISENHLLLYEQELINAAAH